MSLFDLSRGAVARAQSGFGTLSMLNRTGSTSTQQGEPESSRNSTPDSAAPRERKRDQLRNAAVGTIASGVGWLIGAPGPVNAAEEDH
jgi:protein transport protein SEC39